MEFIDTLNLDRFIEIMNAQQFPWFGTNAEKDEIVDNKSFFIYSKEGRIEKATNSHNQYLQEFTLAFITRENAQVNVLQLSDQLAKARLIFRNSDSEEGKFAETDEDTKMTTMTFVHVIKACE